MFALWPEGPRLDSPGQSGSANADLRRPGFVWQRIASPEGAELQLFRPFRAGFHKHPPTQGVAPVGRSALGFRVTSLWD